MLASYIDFALCHHHQSNPLMEEGASASNTEFLTWGQIIEKVAPGAE